MLNSNETYTSPSPEFDPDHVSPYLKPASQATSENSTSLA